MNKQIEEMTEFFMSLETYDHHECVNCGKWEHNCCDDLCFANKVATDLYNAGYRKQSEGEWTYSENGKTMKCTRCRLRMKTYDVRRYCSNCGAKMRKEDEGK